MAEEKFSKPIKIDKVISIKPSFFVQRTLLSALLLLCSMVFSEANAEPLPVKNSTIADGLTRD
jgi:hypothetical protein